MTSHLISKGVERSNYAGQRLQRGAKVNYAKVGGGKEGRMTGRRRKKNRKYCEEVRNGAAVGSDLKV